VSVVGEQTPLDADPIKRRSRSPPIPPHRSACDRPRTQATENPKLRPRGETEQAKRQGAIERWQASKTHARRIMIDFSGPVNWGGRCQTQGGGGREYQISARVGLRRPARRRSEEELGPHWGQQDTQYKNSKIGADKQKKPIDDAKGQRLEGAYCRKRAARQDLPEGHA